MSSSDMLPLQFSLNNFVEGTRFKMTLPCDEQCAGAT